MHYINEAGSLYLFVMFVYTEAKTDNYRFV